MSEPEYSRSYAIVPTAICRMCGEPIIQHTAGALTLARCGCGDVWEGRSNGDITAWRRVEKPVSLPKPAPESPIFWRTIPDYIEGIEEAIRDDVRMHGRTPETPPGRDRIGDSADRLGAYLTNLANRLAIELGMGGDPNITYTHCMTMICYAWSTFILEAKSKATGRYQKEGLDYMKLLVDSQPDLFRRIHEEAVKYGDDYPVDNPKWAAAVAEWEAKQKVLTDGKFVATPEQIKEYREKHGEQ